MRLIIDMDEVICDFLGPLCRQYNHLYGTDWSVSQFSEYDLGSFIGDEGREIFLKAGFFYGLEPYPGSLEILGKLGADGHDVIIASNALGNPDAAADKCRWMAKYLPELLPENFFITSRKYLVRGDLLFDDSPGVLNNFPGIKVVMDRPYNRKVEAHRIYNNNWHDFYRLVSELSKK